MITGLLRVGRVEPSRNRRVIQELRRGTRDASAAGQTRLRLLLRDAASLREAEGAEASMRRRAVWEEILRLEYWAIRQQVIARGYKETGSGWVDVGDVDDVTADACIRATKMFDGFRGSSPREFFKAIATCVQYAVVDYVRRDAARAEAPVDPVSFDPAGDRDGEAGGPSMAASAFVSSSAAADRAEFKETLSQIVSLDGRAATVVTMRMSGYRSAEIAERLGTSSANVDQIFSRSIRALMSLQEEDPT